MEKTPEQFLDDRNKKALADVPVQDAATKEAEEGIEAQRNAIAAAQKARKEAKAQKTT